MKDFPYKKPKTLSRRQFMTRTGLLIGGAVAIQAAAGAVFYKAALDNKKNGKVRQPKESTLVLLGKESDFAQLSEVERVDYQTEIEDGWVTQNVDGTVYVTRDSNNDLLIMSPVCTHLACTVPFASEEEQKSKPGLVFKCPCHGGEFDKMGINVGGPPPRPLDIYQPIVKEGNVYFDYFSPVQRK
jgi:menaquinol-cytochrome c reductase iron-sulfur subunit